MGLFDDAVPGGSIAKPLMIALGALLVGKMMGAGGGPAQQATPMPQQPQGMPGGGYRWAAAGWQADWSAAWAACSTG